MSRPRELRWPVENLDRALIREGHRLRWQKCNALGIPERTWFRWRRFGVPDRSADEAAVRLRVHASLIWPGWSDVDGYGPSDDDEDVALTGEWRLLVGLLRLEVEWADAG